MSRLEVPTVAEEEPFAQEEPVFEVGKDSARLWWKVLIVVILLGVAISLFASLTYVIYPYNVTVSGSFVAKNGSVALYIQRPACDIDVYQACPDPGQDAVGGCYVPLIIRLFRCDSYDLQSTPGHYQMVLRNGENYNITAFMINPDGTYNETCHEIIVLTPVTRNSSSTQNFEC